MDDLEIIDVKDMFDVDVISNDENEYNIVEDLIVDDEVYVSDTIAEDLPNLIEAGQFFIYIPLGSTTTKGIVKFDSKYFTVIDGIVYAKLTPKAIADKNGEDIVDTCYHRCNYFLCNVHNCRLCKERLDLSPHWSSSHRRYTGCY